jgi:UPF0755 protein
MARKKVRKKRSPLLPLLLVVGLAVVGGWFWMQSNLAPLPKAELRYVRFADRSGVDAALQRLQEGKILRNAAAARIYARLTRRPSVVLAGTYRLGPGMSTGEILDALSKPIRQMVRIPETNFSYRTARLLAKREVCTEADYVAEVHKPNLAGWDRPFPAPPGNLEGYLYPDTYELPPMMGAKGVVKRQLDAFQKKVWPQIPKGTDLNHVLTVASMVELEVKKDSERPIVAGVIENRLRQKMRLQIDATINYALKKWRPLTFKDLKLDDPYNTYRNTGLPPGPICSPTVKSILAALKPAKHPYLYYVALPDGSHLFSATFDEHRKNIAKRKAALAKISS